MGSAMYAAQAESGAGGAGAGAGFADATGAADVDPNRAAGEDDVVDAEVVDDEETK
jgi:molecular chaperone DnaK